MGAFLPIPLAFYPRSEQDLTTLSERLGGSVSLRISTKKVARTVNEGAGRKTTTLPEFIEWWLEYPAEFIPNPPSPPPPADLRVRELLEGTARIAAKAWAKEAHVAKGWPPEPKPVYPPGYAAPLPFEPATGGRKGTK